MEIPKILTVRSVQIYKGPTKGHAMKFTMHFGAYNHWGAITLKQQKKITFVLHELKKSIQAGFPKLHNTIVVITYSQYRFFFWHLLFLYTLFLFELIIKHFFPLKAKESNWTMERFFFLFQANFPITVVNAKYYVENREVIWLWLTRLTEHTGNDSTISLVYQLKLIFFCDAACFVLLFYLSQRFTAFN